MLILTFDKIPQSQTITTTDCYLHDLALLLFWAMLVDNGVRATDGEGVPLLSSSSFSDFTLGDSVGARKADCEFT